MISMENKLWSMDENPLQISRQILVATTPGWNCVNGVLQRFEKASLSSEWTPIGKPIAIVVGRNGMAWGRGLHKTRPDTPGLKKEGDGKSPSGIFAISHAFGIDPAAKYNTLKIPYLPLTSAIECVDDATSAYYNQIVDASAVTSDWRSSERMAEYRHEYHLGLVVEHNTNPVEKGAGSCLFIHIWNDKKSGTAGCTAMKESDLVQVVNWIDREKHPLLVQMPQEEMIRFWVELDLPLKYVDLFNGK